VREQSAPEATSSERGFWRPPVGALPAAAVVLATGGSDRTCTSRSLCKLLADAGLVSRGAEHISVLVAKLAW
jgi:hypothetical protein